MDRQFYKNGTVDQTNRMTRNLSIVFICFCVMVVGYTFYNYYQLQKNATQMSMNYVDNYTRLVAQNTNSKIYNNLEMFQTISDSLSHTKNFDDIKALEEFMQRKAAICGFNFIEYVELESNRRAMGGTYPHNFRKSGYQGLLATLEEEVSQRGYTILIKDENLYVAVAVMNRGDELGLLWGGYSKRVLLNSINAHVFDQNMATNIVTLDGEVSLASDDQASLHLAQQIQADPGMVMQLFSGSDSGVYEYKDNETGKMMYFSFHDIGLNDWYLVNSVPIEVFNSVQGRFLVQLLVALCGIVLMFIGFILLQNNTVKRNNKAFKYLAFNDEVTKGINNNGLKATFFYLKDKHLIQQFTLAMIDVVNFKLYNEKYGVSFGDQLLVKIHDTIQTFLDSSHFEYVSRVETDHFFVLLNDNNPHEVVKRLREITNALQFECVNLSKALGNEMFSFRIGASALLPEDNDLETIKARVIIASKSAKVSQYNQVIFFDDNLQNQLKHNQLLIARLSQSLIDEDFKLYIQPKVNQLTNQVEGLEALVRWDCPGVGFLTPDKFVPLFEEIGRVTEIDRYVFNHVCEWLANRKQNNLPVYPISINLSRKHFEDVAFVTTFEQITKSYGIEPYLIEFEVTERIFMMEDCFVNMEVILDRMHEIGFKCSMDDFGVGYSSLSTLRRFPFDIIKLDRSFFFNINDDKNYQVIKCIVELCDALNMKIVAEGIESKQQLELLKQLGIYIIQGYYYARPMPLAFFDDWLHKFDQVMTNSRRTV